MDGDGVLRFCHRHLVLASDECAKYIYDGEMLGDDGKYTKSLP